MLFLCLHICSPFSILISLFLFIFSLSKFIILQQFCKHDDDTIQESTIVITFTLQTSGLIFYWFFHVESSLVLNCISICHLVGLLFHYSQFSDSYTGTNVFIYFNDLISWSTWFCCLGKHYQGLVVWLPQSLE